MQHIMIKFEINSLKALHFGTMQNDTATQVLNKYGIQHQPGFI
jgi:hypothetical protein